MKQNLSQHEIDRKHAFQQLMIAIQECDEFIDDQYYIIIERNSTDDYTVSFDCTFDGSWADTCFELDVAAAKGSAECNKGDRYVVVLAKLDNKQLNLIKEYNVIK